MSDEKIMILKMLEDGKIGAEEAAKLLAAVNDEEPKKKAMPNLEKSQNTTYNSNDNNSNNSNDNLNTASTGSKVNFDEFGRTIGNISKNMAKKIGVLAKEMAPKIQNVTENLVEKTVEVTDKISKSVATPPPRPSRPVTPPPARPVTPPARTTTPVSKGRIREKSCEISVSGTLNEFYVISKNGSIFIKGYNGDKITAKLSYTSNTDNIDLTQSGNRYYLDYDENAFSSVSIEAFVPDKLFKRIQLEAQNSKISLDSMSCPEIVAETDCFELNLKNISSNYIKATTDKGNIELNNIASDTLDAITATGKINATALDVKKLKMETDNSPIDYKLFSLRNYTEYDWKISTSNAPMRVNMPISEEIGYSFKANTSLNSVSVGIAELQYTYNENNYVQAKTNNFERAYRKVQISMDTSNAPININ